MRFDIDVAFSAELPGQGENRLDPVRGTISAAGKIITVKLDSLSVLPSMRSIDRLALNATALKLKKAGVTIEIEGPEGKLVSIGDVKPNFLSRIGTSSSAIKIGKPVSVSAFLGRASSSQDAQPMQVPATMFPLMPTFLKTYRRKPTTTHYARGGGRPRIIFVKDSDSWDGKAPKVLNVTSELMKIGSAADSELVLPGLDPMHAQIVHNELDEYVLIAVGPVSGSAGLRPGSEYVLRSGARIELGEWRLVFYREEYADHGRPFGGRNGGELSFQRPQFNPRTGFIERDSSE